MANPDLNSVSIWLGDGTGNFNAASQFDVDHVPFSIAVGDFNGDGQQDLAVANRSSGDVSTLLGNGDGTFSFVAGYSVGTWPFSVVVGDFNGDGKQDLAVGNRASNNVAILLGDGAGHFTPPAKLPLTIRSPSRWAILMTTETRTSRLLAGPRIVCRSWSVTARAISVQPDVSLRAMVLKQWRWAILTATVSKIWP